MNEEKVRSTILDFRFFFYRIMPFGFAQGKNVECSMKNVEFLNTKLSHKAAKKINLTT